ncbi:hypothetical protein ACGFYQ_07840 [Streptomyces sp. NPDC048258]|uniref:hypothetical protein n=1 Tax=Streptomyces sp. NPDC048258 TaxID=3365527 RepID=UPI0037205BC9
MSESVPPSEQPENAPGPGVRKRVPLGRLVPRSKGARWAALGAAAVIVGGGAVAVAVAEHHDDRARAFGGPHAAWAGPGHESEGKRGPGDAGEKRERMRFDMKGLGPKELGALKERGGKGGGHGVPGAPGDSAKAAPLPLPSLAIGQAAEKAAGAVEGGKVESVRVVAQEGGGSAWLAVVIGPDGVRHAVTVSGTDGTVTGNTTLTARR